MYSIYWLIAKYLFLVGILKLARYKSNWRPWNGLMASSSGKRIPDGKKFRQTHTHTHTHTTSHRDAAHSLKYWLRLREWPPTPVFLPGELHEQRSLAGYNSWLRKDMTEWLSRSVQFLPPVVFLYLSCFQNKHGTIALHSSEVMCSLVLFQI